MTPAYRLTPAAATSVLAGVLAAVALAVTVLTPSGRILLQAPAAPAWVIFVCFVAAFACAEVGMLHVELQRHTSSFSLSGVALLVGVLFCDVHLLIAARVLGGLLIFAGQRLSVLKVTYNLSAYALETALVAFGLHELLGSGIRMTLATAALCLPVVSIVDMLMSSLVLLVISWHQGRLTTEQMVRVFVPASALAVLSTLGAVTIVVLLSEGAVGATLIVIIAALGALIYRGYLILRRRHQSLAMMHEFVAQGVGAATVQELAQVLLARTRRLLNAAEVQLILFGEQGDLSLRVLEDDSLGVQELLASADVDAGALAGDWLIARVRQNVESIVIARTTRERGMRQWLLDHRARDAMILALPSTSVAGVLIVTDRLGETSTFTPEDLRLLETLAAHLAVALRGTQLVEQLRHDATHDALTGLANRVLLTEGIENCLAGPGACDDLAPAVLLLDLDKFKEVNDALGHHLGDALLQVVAQRIEASVPSGSIVARLGGDEFAVLVPQAGRVGATAAAEAIRDALCAPVVLPDAVLNARASIGFTVAAAGLDGADLLRHADTAMYAAKASGSGSIMLYTEALDEGRTARLSLLSDLHLALERDELELHYQPQVDLLTNEVVSVEALVRWQHPRQGLLYPDVFIPLAEQSGLIEELTDQVLRKALLQCRVWRDRGLDLVVAVNMSAHSTNNESLAEDVAAALAAAGLPPDRLVLEITESIVMDDPARAVPVLQRLADLGVTLSLDDFGTGYSSLAYLQRLPVREVKIDKSFVMGLTPGADGQASSVLVRTILTLAAALGLRVVAEGVEDAGALEMLRDLGCDLVQGYHISRPLPAAGIEAFLLRRSAIPGPRRLSAVKHA